MSLRSFCELVVRLHGQPFSLTGRPYLHQIYNSTDKNIVIRASRQVEKSTFLANRIIYDCYKYRRIRILFVSPRQEQAELFSRDRLQATIQESPILSRLLWPKSRPMPVRDICFPNGSRVYVRPAFHSADGVRGISADEIFIDEFQDVAPGQLPVMQETLSHSATARTVLTGTPKLIDNHLEAAFTRSTANEWRIPCDNCPELALLDERVLGLTSLVCAACGAALDVQRGYWLPRNPHSEWGQGYWINHLMASWLNVADVLARRSTYDPIRFRNEVLGLAVHLGDHIVTREELEACCDAYPTANRISDVPLVSRRGIIAGIDWGGGVDSATVLAVGYVTPGNRSFNFCRFDRWGPRAEPEDTCRQIAVLCNQLGVRGIAADGGGNGSVYNRLLLRAMGRLVPFWAIHYSAADQEPIANGDLTQWTVNRTASIGTLFMRIKLGQIRFPRVADSGSFLDEIASEVVQYDDLSRSFKYMRTPGQRDDALHACNYAHVLALRTVRAHH